MIFRQTIQYFASSAAIAVRVLQRERIIEVGMMDWQDGDTWETDQPIYHSLVENHKIGRITTDDEYIYFVSGGTAMPGEHMAAMALAKQEADAEQVARDYADAQASFPQLAIFMRDRKGGVHAVNKAFLNYTKRPCFPERRGVQPKPGEVYEILSLTDNPTHTVWFCKLGRKVSDFPTVEVSVGYFGYVGYTFLQDYDTSYEHGNVSPLWDAALKDTELEVGQKYRAILLNHPNLQNFRGTYAYMLQQIEEV